MPHAIGKKGKKLFSPNLAKAKLVVAAGGRPTKAQKSALRVQAKALTKAAGGKKSAGGRKKR